LKGLRATIIGGSVAAVGSVGAALVNYVVEHGELPAWSSGAFSWLSSLMLIQAPWALWEILATFLTPCLAFGVLVYYLSHSHSALVDEFNERNDKLRLVEITKRRLEKDCIELKSANAELLDENNILKGQSQSIPAEQPAQAALTDRHISILLVLAECENASIITTTENLYERSNLQKVALISTLDDLRDFGYILRISMDIGKKYQLTASGRRLVLSVN
jgi:predicted transcriptional regulator